MTESAAVSRDHVILKRFFSSDPEAQDARRRLQKTLTTATSVDEFLNFLVQISFDRCRYYQMNHRDRSEEWSLVLVAQASRDGQPRSPQGFRIPWTESTLSRAGITPILAAPPIDQIVCDFGHPDDRRRHVDKLQLKGRTWVEIPIISGPQVVGVIAGDWQAQRTPTDSDNLFLLLLARWIHDVVSHAPLLPFDAITVACSFPAARNLDKLAEPRIAELLYSARDRSRAAMFALFFYDWTTGMVHKCEEIADPQIISTLEPYPESYMVGHYYTGRAWLDPTARYIPDFGLALAEGALEDDIHPGSLDRHRGVMTGVSSLLYETCGELEGGFLLRAMRHREDPHQSFGELRDSFGSVARELGAEFDVRATRSLLYDLTQLAVAASQASLDLRGIRDEITAVVERRCLPAPTYLIDTGDEVEVWKLSATSAHQPHALLKPGALNKLLTLKLPNFIDRNDLPALLQQALPDAEGFYASLCHDPLRCAVLSPIATTFDDEHGSYRRDRTEFERLLQQPNGDMLLLDLLPGLLASAHRAAHFYDAGTAFGAGFARYLRHELLSRANRLAHTSNLLVSNLAPRLAPGRDRDRVEEGRKSVQRLQLELNRALRPASLLRGAEIHLNFAPVRPADLLQAAVQEIQNRFTREFCDEWDIKNFALWLEHASSDRVSDGKPDWLVCDRELMVQALVGILDNAIKYSNPRYPGLVPSRQGMLAALGQARSGASWALLGRGPNPARRGTTCLVEVRAQRRGGSYEFEVENWGVPVPEGPQQAALWNVFRRGGVMDPRRKVPGLGLGLYLARIAAESHLGEARIDSTRTLSDPSVRHRHGFRTRCWLRVSAELRPGDFAWADTRARREGSISAGPVQLAAGDRDT